MGMKKILNRLAIFLRSSSFYVIIIGIFIFEASWIALSAKYPQAFDENTHFGLIKVYSHYWLPFLTKQPPHADRFGAVAREPSFLYHYLMSFPYRLIALFIKKQILQVIILRFIDIIFFAVGLSLFRRIMLRLGTSKALANTILLLFVLIPIVPQLAGQVSYDDLFIPLTALMILIAFRLYDEIKAKNISIWTVMIFLGGSILTSLVKYAFLPFFAAMLLYLGIILYQQYKLNFRLILKQLVTTWYEQKLLAKVMIVFLAIVPLAMFIERDGVNLVLYHSIQYNCPEALSVKQCKYYSPWKYNYKNHLLVLSHKASYTYTNPFIYFFQWLYWMWYRLFFAVNGPKSYFKNYPPLPLPSAATIVLTVVGVAALVRSGKKLIKVNKYMLFCYLLIFAYVLALLIQGYTTYRYTHILENMNGRYLLPIIILTAAILGQAISLNLKRFNSSRVLIMLVVIVLFLDGGGLFTFIIRSNKTWDIDNKSVISVNNQARKVTKTFIATGHKHYKTSFWFYN